MLTHEEKYNVSRISSAVKMTIEMNLESNYSVAFQCPLRGVDRYQGLSYLSAQIMDLNPVAETFLSSFGMFRQNQWLANTFIASACVYVWRDIGTLESVPDTLSLPGHNCTGVEDCAPQLHWEYPLQ